MVKGRLDLRMFLFCRLSSFHFFTPATGLLDQLRHQAGPSGLVTSTQTRIIVAMKVFIEQNSELFYQIYYC